MTKYTLTMLLTCLAQSFFGQTLTPFELDDSGNTTATYAETIAFYEALARDYNDYFQFSAFGETDSGYPLHVGVVSSDGEFDPEEIHKKNRLVIFINNAIHPGEPCGVDATMMLVRDILEKPTELSLPKAVTLVFIPFYNVGGGLNRGSSSRANQVGPKAHGFRGNARNYDLNRDFIKCDTKNAQSFNQLYAKWNPEIFIDNHTSNGADYQYTLTLIATQAEKLGGPLAKYLSNKMLPYLYADMKHRGWEMTPYVYARNIPDDGIAGFLDLPRYSSGYAALFHTLSFMPETHMLKPYKDRVASVYEFMCSTIALAQRDKDQIQRARHASIAKYRQANEYATHWEIDETQVEKLVFKGYEAIYKPSAVSGLDRLYYDHSQPYIKEIPFFNSYKPTQSSKRPKAYILPATWTAIVDRLQWNGVQMNPLEKDTTLYVEQYYIEDFTTVPSPYEGHYLHSGITTRSIRRNWNFRAGDFIIPTDQPAIRYIMETLEPTAPDSYFAWNFFDAILQQKEHFSSYVFEDLAAEYLNEHPQIKAAFEEKKKVDKEFAASARKQLEFIYRRSPYYELTHKLYPVARLWH